MTRWIRLLSAAGGLFVALAVSRAVLILAAGGSLAALLIDFVLVAGPGFTLLYVRYRVLRTAISADLYPRVTGWCLGGIGVMVGVIALLVVNPAGNVDHPIRAGLLGAALGSVGGLGVGLNEARAITQAREVERAQLRADLAEQRNRQLNEFTALVSHDLRGPLRTMSSSLTFLQQRYEDDLDEDVQEFLDFAVDGAEQMDHLLDDLLALTRAERVVDNPTPLEVTEVIADAWETLETRDADLAVEVEEFLILAERGRLKQLLENLFRNSIVHGGPNVCVQVGRLPDGFYVADDGPGIAAENREQVFESGYTTTADKSGFGLSIVKRIAEAHGWDIRFVNPHTPGVRCEITDVESPTPAN